ncbi:hypothetical protein AL755_08560 [Arthrobacter sp. ERGS1:01]|uniref:hypothetical protein n=1 Tax=Arthrobacter sp. ERGS1:01 TaxID=1704044 RepID=UPI0006B53F46|nr:hypothetical protein [Arthrobacter sp. ERGS1:01]ALE05519.1 hypothetical protein AL755_08560 [Arthrobacter sp. ERGS1:01]
MTLPTFIAREAVQVANEGGHVVILTQQPHDVLTDLLNNSGEELARTIRRTNGNEGLDFHAGGKIRLVRRADEFRGHSAALVIIPIGTSHDDMITVLPSLADTHDSAIVGYH